MSDSGLGCLQVSLEQWIIAPSKKILITRPKAYIPIPTEFFSHNVYQIYLELYGEKLNKNLVERLSQFSMTNRCKFFF